MRSYVKPGDVRLLPPAVVPRTGGGRLAIVVPVISGRLTPDEEVSLSLLRRFGGDHPKFILHPEGLDLDFDLDGFQTLALDPANFDGISAYNALMMAAWFYRLFAGFESILIYQTDCLLLSGEIEPWLDKPWSYYGAPYFRRNGQLKSVGNGGFSLRRVADHLDVLGARDLSLGRMTGAMLRQYLKGTYFRYLARHLTGADHSAKAFVAGFDRAEDEFWIYYAPLFSTAFKLPPPMQVVGFAAESRSERVVELNGGRLPLGVHAWARHDRPFWVTALKGLGVDIV